MTLPHTPLPDARQRARDGLRRRAVLYEAHRHTDARARKHTRFCLLPHVADELPALSLHLDITDGYPPNVARSAAARIRHLNGMFTKHGPLVLLRFSLPALDAYPLHERTLVTEAREAVADALFGLLADDAPYTVDIHRGAEGGTHAHAVTPLAFVLEDWRGLLADAPHGPGGGRDLPFLAGHGVVIRNTARDRARVAAYVRRHPDGRLWTPGTEDYLHALEDELQRKHMGLPLPRLAWDAGVRHLPTK
ncbi:hypothetical protein DEIPH_ctg042orf0004 [Deinococcus phoenicis]|uniref:Uncharacterized protein n=1 Tax=Deinococcus phoenicis TaxID=1476583 RepID=A0A016QMN1_9DEIO|nr:hypothetical protein [Deinococcus phoenicis]EYB67405.1 hypothetical protein DEIPH_ctg042orf0004 [Deinococcus phoenicis]